MSGRSVFTPTHLGDLVSGYVDRTLPAAVQHRLDRHLVACEVCRAAADQERRLLGALRATTVPGVSPRLAATLRGLAAPVPVSVPPAPRVSGPALVPPRAPSLHHSPVRAALLAALAAGASAAAAWGVGVGVAGATTPPAAPPGRGGPVVTGGSTARAPVPQPAGLDVLSLRAALSLRSPVPPGPGPAAPGDPVVAVLRR